MPVMPLAGRSAHPFGVFPVRFDHHACNRVGTQDRCIQFRLVRGRSLQHDPGGAELLMVMEKFNAFRFPSIDLKHQTDILE
ncbi:MAG: hypothetical protein BWY82_02410 [Verrucomicrobia bacterium ADurb.Bin474]|nr:MAG: hypothetical protein BWY82_02410 [Verrucomicrobia bacterium ADurb.Bin474]